jgi:hypothetical protein
MEEARIVTSGREIKARGDVAQHDGVRPVTTRFQPVVSTDQLTAPVLGRDGCPFGLTIIVKEAAVSTRGRLLHATTDWRILCRPISSIPAVRQLSAGKSVGRSDSSPGSPRGEEGGKLSKGCARRARKLGGAAHWGGDLRAGEKVRERAGVAREVRARRISSPGDRTGEHTGKRRRRYGRAGVHTENAWKQTRRQRLGVARRSADTHGNTRCIPVFWVWGGR